MNNLTVITLKADEIKDYSAARNRELSKATTDWVLFLDSDETLTPELEKELALAIKSKEYSAYRLSRLDTFLGRQLRHGENAHNRFVRLAKKDWGVWQRPVHEVWVGKGRVGALEYPLLHQLGTISDLLAKINRYSTHEAEYRFKLGKHSSLLHIALLPPAKFIRNYICRLGVLDGTAGTIMAVLMSLHSFLTWTKLYLLWKRN